MQMMQIQKLNLFLELRAIWGIKRVILATNNLSYCHCHSCLRYYCNLCICTSFGNSCETNCGEVYFPMQILNLFLELRPRLDEILKKQYQLTTSSAIVTVIPTTDSAIISAFSDHLFSFCISLYTNCLEVYLPMQILNLFLELRAWGF
jgi:hypothetical protein